MNGANHLCSVQENFSAILKSLNRNLRTRTTQAPDSDPYTISLGTHSPKANSLHHHSAPIHRLPVELLEVVFINCIPKDPSSNTSEAPLLLLHVCQFWRYVALSHSLLWTSLVVFPECIERPLGSHDFCSGLGVFAGQWFQRAGSLPLNIDFRPPETYALADLERLVNCILIPHSRHCRTLRLNLFSVSPFGSFLSMSPSYLENLESLDIEINSQFADINASIFACPPRLRRVSLSPIMSYYQECQLNFPWPQLTHLTISNKLSFDNWRIIVGQCINLQHGDFSLRQYRHGLLSHPRIALLQLHYMDLRMDYGCLTDLHDIILPALTYLCLRHFISGDVSQGRVPEIPHLKTLRLVGGNPSTFLGFLETTPSISDIQITCAHPQPLRAPSEATTLIQGLLPKARPILLPRLETLSVDIAMVLSERAIRALSHLVCSRGPRSTALVCPEVEFQNIVCYVHHVQGRSPEYSDDHEAWDIMRELKDYFTRFGVRLYSERICEGDEWPCGRCM